VVILGLVGVKIAQYNPALGFLEKADAVAALIVAAIVVLVSGKLGLRTVHALLDASPEGVADQIKARVEAMENVFDCHAVRVRHSGPHYFVDLHITLDGNLPLHAAHALTEEVERVVRTTLLRRLAYYFGWQPASACGPRPDRGGGASREFHPSGRGRHRPSRTGTRDDRFEVGSEAEDSVTWFGGSFQPVPPTIPS
jgi:hypothetical protein